MVKVPKFFPEGDLPEDVITVLLVACECLHYFKALADHRPPLSETRLDKSAMAHAVAKKTRNADPDKQRKRKNAAA